MAITKNVSIPLSHPLVPFESSDSTAVLVKAFDSGNVAVFSHFYPVPTDPAATSMVASVTVPSAGTYAVTSQAVDGTGANVGAMRTQSEIFSDPKTVTVPTPN